MCGFVGWVLKKNSDIDCYKARLRTALELIKHRGPDSTGYINFDNVLLGHVRLSILDLSKSGSQPMSTVNERYVLIYNGEVYNYKELASKHHLTDLRSQSDSEIVLKLFEKYGVKCFSMFNGMFSLAIYDKKEGKVWLARDRLGIKPLYFSVHDDSFCFASEMKSIFELSKRKKIVNTSAIHEWTYYGNTLGTKTLYKSVQKLLPGHLIELNVSNLSVKISRYWEPKVDFLPSQLKPVLGENLYRDVRYKLETAVKRQLVSDVPVGVFLSGGIDSSAITAFASKHYEGKLSSYSVGFDFDNGNNELPLAKEVAAQYGTDHHELHISGFDVADIVEKMIHHHDAPFSDAANIPLFLLCEKVKDTTKVVLQGDGGDELFGGYQRYKTLSHLRSMKLLARLGELVNGFLPKNASYYSRQRYINALLAPSDAEVMALLLTVEDRQRPPSQIFLESYRNLIERTDPFERYRECENIYAGEDLANRMLMIDSSIILPDIFFEKVDRSTMASSVEVRVPFLDNDLVEFCFNLPSDIKLNRGVQKWLLKKSLEGVVPNKVLYGKKKGFGVPFGAWVKGPLQELLFDHVGKFTSNNKGILDESYINKSFSELKTGRRDTSFLMWKLLNFVIWANKNKVEFNN